MENVTSFKRRATFQVVDTERFITGRKTLEQQKKSGDETIVLSSHFVLERGKREIIQRRVEAFKGLSFLICLSVSGREGGKEGRKEHLLMLPIVRCPQSVSASLCYR